MANLEDKIEEDLIQQLTRCTALGGRSCRGEIYKGIDVMEIIHDIDFSEYDHRTIVDHYRNRTDLDASDMLLRRCIQKHKMRSLVRAFRLHGYSRFADYLDPKKRFMPDHENDEPVPVVPEQPEDAYTPQPDKIIDEPILVRDAEPGHIPEPAAECLSSSDELDVNDGLNVNMFSSEGSRGNTPSNSGFNDESNGETSDGAMASASPKAAPEAICVKPNNEIRFDAGSTDDDERDPMRPTRGQGDALHYQDLQFEIDRSSTNFSTSDRENTALHLEDMIASNQQQLAGNTTFVEGTTQEVTNQITTQPASSQLSATPDSEKSNPLNDEPAVKQSAEANYWGNSEYSLNIADEPSGKMDDILLPSTSSMPSMNTSTSEDEPPSLLLESPSSGESHPSVPPSFPSLESLPSRPAPIGECFRLVPTADAPTPEKKVDKSSNETAANGSTGNINEDNSTSEPESDVEQSLSSVCLSTYRSSVRSIASSASRNKSGVVLALGLAAVALVVVMYRKVKR